LDIAGEHEFLVWTAVATCLHGAALARMGQAEEGLAQVLRGIDSYQELNTPPVFWPMLIFMQAEVCGLAGKPELGIAELDRASELFGSASEDILLPEFFRLKGELLLAVSPDHAPQAESWFQRAVQLAQKLHLPMLELRAAISLGRLWKDQGKAEPARQLLSGAYEKFTEGFKTPDLREAKDLLR
jgi:predicted ATPase